LHVFLSEILTHTKGETSMSKKHKGAGPIPKGNQPHFGPQAPPEIEEKPADGAPASEHDPKQRMGDFETEGEHAIQQPGGKQGANK
jgi:hypothetical protein